MKMRHWIILFCLSLNCGCALINAIDDETLHRDYYHKWFPGAKPLYEKLDQDQAIKVMQEVIDESIPDTWCPGIISKTPLISESGVNCVFKIIIKHRECVGSDIRGNKLISYYKNWETDEPDEDDILNWQSVTRVDIRPVHYIKFGKCWSFYVCGPWTMESKYERSGFGFSVFTEKQRDKAIASLLRLCPNL